MEIKVREISSCSCKSCDGTGSICAACCEIVDNCTCDLCMEIDCASCDGGRLNPDNDDDDDNTE